MPRQIPGVIIGLAVLALVGAAAAQGDPRNTPYDLMLLFPAAGAYLFMVRNWFLAPAQAEAVSGDVVSGDVVSVSTEPGGLRWLMRTAGLALVLAALCLAGAADFMAQATGRTALFLGVLLVVGYVIGRK